MVNLSKIKTLAKENGYSLSYIASRLGLKPSYFTDVKNGKTKISDARLEIIADLLNTTKAYLTDQTEDKTRRTLRVPEWAKPSPDTVQFVLLGHDGTQEFIEIKKEDLAPIRDSLESIRVHCKNGE